MFFGVEQGDGWIIVSGTPTLTRSMFGKSLVKIGCGADVKSAGLQAKNVKVGHVSLPQALKVSRRGFALLEAIRRARSKDGLLLVGRVSLSKALKVSRRGFALLEAIRRTRSKDGLLLVGRRP